LICSTAVSKSIAVINRMQKDMGATHPVIILKTLVFIEFHVNNNLTFHKKFFTRASSIPFRLLKLFIEPHSVEVDTE
jgi:hypothetical protein